MSRQLMKVAETVYTQKDIAPEIIFEAIELALVMAAKRTWGQEHDYRVSVDIKSGEYETFRVWHVVEDDMLENPEAEYTLEQAREIKADVSIGDTIEEAVDSVDFGRIAAQTAKQVILQRVKEAQRQKLADQYQTKLNQLVSGTVKRVLRDQFIIDLTDGAEASLMRDDTIPREIFRVGDRVRAYLKEVCVEGRGPLLKLNRICPEILVELMKIEIPEVAEELIQVKAVVRDPGLRAKVAVHTNDGRLDPVGACVGMRGSRIQSISSELGGERVDVVQWDDNPVEYVMKALSVDVVSIVIDEDARSMDVAVKEDQLSQAIGRNGQNVRLAGALTGWRISVLSEKEAEEKQQREQVVLTEFFMESLDIDMEVSELLVDAGFSTIEEVAYVPEEEMLEIEAFDEDIIEELRERAKNAILARALSGDKAGGLPADDLLKMSGMNPDLAYTLAGKGIRTMEDLAEQSIDDLLDIESMDEAMAGQLIMTAREPWFKEE